MVSDRYDFWLFDLDGTLVDVDPSYPREVFDRVGDRLGRPFTDREVETLWHGLGGARNPRLRALGIDPEEFWPLLHDVEDPETRAEATYLHDDAAALLAAVEATGTPAGVVTHCAPFLADPVLDRLDLRDRFDAIVCCSDDVGWKPDAAPVERAMAKIGVTADADAGAAGVLAGDGPSDVGAAWNAGLDAIHVERHGHERRERCVLADHRVRSFDDLRTAVIGGDRSAEAGAAGAAGESAPSPRSDGGRRPR